MERKIYLLLLMTVLILPMSAQIDPTLSSMIYLYTDKAEDELKSQERVLMIQSTGHLWIKEGVEGTTDLQRKFNDYLDSFRDIICYAAQIYGFYHEIGRLTDNMGGLIKQLGRSPDNALAVALTPRRNQIYREIILGSVEIVNDIRHVCLSGTKMTEKQCVEIVFAIRPKLKLMNKRLQRLTRAVKYTSFADVWAEIEDGAREKSNKMEITQACMRRWRRAADR